MLPALPFRGRAEAYNANASRSKRAPARRRYATGALFRGGPALLGREVIKVEMAKPDIILLAGHTIAKAR